MSSTNDESKLLDRDSFRNGVLERDGHKCVICGASGVRLDAHHIMERRLFDDGGYFLDNGATLCDVAGDSGEPGCHWKAEQTVLTCDEIRAAAGIKTIILPDHLYHDYAYDKWGNILNPDGTRTKGELFYDESVQKVLKAGGVLSAFRNYVKYPRTFHLPWSPGLTDDDRCLPDTGVFEGREIAVTEKMDGENTTLYRDYMHARSLELEHHESRGWVKKLHAEICWNIPEGWRVCGENLFALHSIRYAELPSYFLVFSIWDENNVCQSWEDTAAYAGVLGLETVPVTYRGPWDERIVRGLEKSIDAAKQEGYVVRVAGAFPYGAFRKSMAKWVRKDHVQTTHGWKTRAVVRNGMRPGKAGGLHFL
jgi:hypothetical protein